MAQGEAAADLTMPYADVTFSKEKNRCTNNFGKLNHDASVQSISIFEIFIILLTWEQVTHRTW